MTTFRLPGLVLTDTSYDVPLDHDRSDGPRIEVFAREVVAPRRTADDLPWLIYLQGGPGGKAPRPTEVGGWLKRALEDYRVLLLDQRGTGRSTPATRQTLAPVGDVAAQASYLAHFRADSIVRDAEHIRRTLIGPGGRWSLLGQSYGGFCALTYLSQAPEHLDSVCLTGGLPPLSGGPDPVYRRTYAGMRERTAAYYTSHPGDEALTGRIADALASADVRLPSGDPLPVERFQQLGMELGAQDGSASLHYLVEEAWAGADLSDAFLGEVEARTTFRGGPLYAVLHESIYCQGEASDWAAQRLRDGEEWLDPALRPVGFSGEMIYPWMFEVDSTLRPLRPVAELLAAKADWPRLYDLEQLGRNDVPVAAAVYHDDAYVAADLSLETARQVRGLRTWVTNEHEHDGLRRSGGDVLGRLLAMTRGEA